MDTDHVPQPGVYWLTCFKCSNPLLERAQELIVDAHGAFFLSDSDVQRCPEDFSVWYIKEGVWPDWIQEQVDQVCSLILFSTSSLISLPVIILHIMYVFFGFQNNYFTRN
jgi:hypothetical protein